MEHLDQIIFKLNLHELDKVQILKDIQAKTQIRPAYLGLGAIVLAALLALLGYGSTLLFFVIGFLYPAYKSFKAIESKDLEDDKQWLTYWAVFSFIHVFDPILSFVFKIIPFFMLVKLAFNIWLLHPKTRGAYVIYNNAIKPLLKKYEGLIDTHIDKVKKTVEEAQPMLNNATRDLKREVINHAIN